MSETLDLGPCCACEGLEGVRNIIMLDIKGTAPGFGWGCFVCHLPFDGAVAVLCDHCRDAIQDGRDAALRFAVDGMLEDKKRIPIDELTAPHKHDLSKHPEVPDYDPGGKL